MRARSRDSSGRARGIGANVFASTPAPTCPPGQHWVPDTTPTVLKGLGACVPNVVTVKPLVFHPPPAPAPATVVVKPLVFQTPPPATTDQATAPSTVTTETCPAPWSLWWLVVAFGAGAYVGHYAVKNQKAVNRNAGRLANLAATRAVNAGVARLLG